MSFGKSYRGGYGPAVEPLYLCETPRGVKSGKPMALYLARGFAAGTLAAEPAPAFDRTEMLMSHYNELATRIGETAGEIREMFRETGLPYETTIGCYEESYAVILLLLLTRELEAGLSDEMLRTVRVAGLLPPLLTDERLKELTDARIGAPEFHAAIEAIETYTNERDDLEMYMKEIRQLPEGETVVSRLLPVSVLGNGTLMDMEVFHLKMKMLEEQSNVK